MAIKTTLHNTRENPYTLWPGWQISSTTMVITMRIPQNLKQEQPYDPAVPLTGMCLKDSTETCLSMLSHNRQIILFSNS